MQVEQQQQQRQRKFVVLGFSAVGKSALTNQFVHEHFPDYYNPTIEATFHKVVRFKGRDTEILIRDTAGQDEYTIFHHRYCVGVHGYVLLYSVDNRQSFEMVKIINEKLLNLIGTDRVPRVLVGNKIDLDDERKVSQEEARALADSWGCPFVECSAKINHNIGKIFSLLLNEIEKEEKDDTHTDSNCLSLCRRVLSVRHKQTLDTFSSVLICATLAIGLATAIIGAILGLGAHLQSSWLSYLMLVVGLFTLLMSFLGLVGIRQSNRDFQLVYCVSLLLVVVVQLASVSYLLASECESCTYVQERRVSVVTVSFVSLLIEIIAVALSFYLRNSVVEEITAYQMLP
uniref:Rheb n=1 Tax=Colponema vietnamica TaxID=1492817 RepID=A0A2R4IKX3_9ALVE|nr:Rheb [Colponema vietnamica]